MLVSLLTKKQVNDKYQLHPNITFIARLRRQVARRMRGVLCHFRSGPFPFPQPTFLRPPSGLPVTCAEGLWERECARAQDGRIPGTMLGMRRKTDKKLIIFSQNVLKCSCNTELIPEKLILCSINGLFWAEKLENNANYASSAFFGKMMKTMLVRPDYAKNYASTIYSSLHVCRLWDMVFSWRFER